MFRLAGCFPNITHNVFGLGEGGLCGNKSLPAFAKPVLYEGGISRTTLSSKHVKRKIKNERGKQLNHLKCKRTFYYLT